jgi:hypothetical protein
MFYIILFTLCRKEQVRHFIECPIKDIEEFEAERGELMKAHEKKKLELEKDLDAALMALMDKHKARHPLGLQLMKN